MGGTEGDTLPLFGVIAQGHHLKLERMARLNNLCLDFRRRMSSISARISNDGLPCQHVNRGRGEDKVTNRRTLDGFRRVRMRKIQGSEGPIRDR